VENIAFRLHGRIHGTGRAPWLVFLHGFLGDGRDWDEIATELKTHFSCLCVDLPGHGASRVERPCAPGEILDALFKLLDECRIDRCGLIGYSMGGRVALRMAVAAPDRINRLVLESASPGIQADADRLARQKADAAWMALMKEGGMEAFLEKWYAQPLFDTLCRNPARREELHQRRMRQDPRQLAMALQSMGAGAWPPAWKDWPSLRMPALLIAGRDDARYAAMAERMAAQNSRAQVWIVSGCGHNVHWEDPASYTAAIQKFLMDT